MSAGRPEMEGEWARGSGLLLNCPAEGHHQKKKKKKSDEGKKASLDPEEGSKRPKGGRSAQELGSKLSP